MTDVRTVLRAHHITTTETSNFVLTGFCISYYDKNQFETSFKFIYS